MVGVFKKHATAVFSGSSPQKPLSNVPQRELKKRKSVRFEDQSFNENNASTSDPTSDGKQLGYAASCFGLVDEHRNSRREGETAELLGLCNFFEAEEKQPNLTDDGDEYIPYDVFAEQGMRMSYKPLSTGNPTVSSLDLTTMLRIDSCVSTTANRNFEKREEEENIPSAQLLEEKEQMEMAFQGNLPCFNQQKTQNRRSSLSEKAQKLENVPEEEEDFWSHVEF